MFLIFVNKYVYKCLSQAIILQDNMLTDSQWCVVMCLYVFHFPSYITSYVVGSCFFIYLIMFCHQFWSMICTLISFIFMSSRLPSESCSLSLDHVCLSSSIDIWYGMILWIYVMPNISFAINSVILHISIYMNWLKKDLYILFDVLDASDRCMIPDSISWQGGRESPEAISCRPSWAPRSGRGV